MTTPEQLVFKGVPGSPYSRNAPALLCSAQSLQPGKEQMETIIDGKPWTQPAFPYQAKCLKWINDEYRNLASVHRQAIDAILADTGCETLINRRIP